MTFDHRAPGTPETVWAAAPRLDSLPPLDPPSGGRLVVLSAHPDDETLGAAGLLRQAADRGLAVEVVVATDGEASHPRSSTRTPAELATARRTELIRALAELAPAAEIRFLGLPDGRLREYRSTLRRRLTGQLEGGDTGRTVLCAPWRGDGHGDHRIAGEVAAEVASATGARLLEYPIWMWHWAGPDDAAVPWDRLCRLDLSPAERSAKGRAMAEHRTQTRPLSDAEGDEVLLHPVFQEHFTRPFEVFVTSAPGPLGSRPPQEGRAFAGAESEPGAGTKSGAGAESEAGVVVEPEPGATPEPDSGAGREGSAGGSLPGAYFDEFYRGREDPWGFESRWYEERKRALTVASLPRRTFRRALEVGCSTGVLTRQLAPRCELLVGIDIAEAPLRAARRRLGLPEEGTGEAAEAVASEASAGGIGGVAGESATPGPSGVELRRMAAPAQWPEGEFDLVVLSEVGYYSGEEDLGLLLHRVLGSLSADGVLLACHWRHPVADYLLDGDRVHAAIGARPELAVLARHLEEDFVLEVLTRPPAVSVATETGLLP